MDIQRTARSVGGVLVLVAFLAISLGDAFVEGVHFNPWLVVVMLALIYALLGLEHFVLDYFPLRLEVSTPNTGEDVDGEQDDSD